MIEGPILTATDLSDAAAEALLQADAIATSIHAPLIVSVASRPFALSTSCASRSTFAQPSAPYKVGAFVNAFSRPRRAC